MLSTLRTAAFSAAVAAIAFTPGNALAQKKYDTGATDTEIKIGNIIPYSGPASAYGLIGKTEEAYFKMINDKGGINGRKINFVSYDDAYSPPKAVEQVRKLVESDEVLVVFNPLGTPSNTAIQKYLNGKKIPQLFVATGATKWNDAKGFPWTMGWQPSYQSEAQIYATPKFGAQTIKKTAELGWKPLQIMTNVSASVGAVMQPAGFDNSQGVLSAAYAKDAADAQWKSDPGMMKWSEFMDKYMPGADRTDSALVYGYGAAQTLAKVLEMCGDDLTRANVMKQAASLKDFTPDTLLPGVKINTSATDFAPISQLQMQRFKGEKWELFGDIISGDVATQ